MFVFVAQVTLHFSIIFLVIWWFCRSLRLSAGHSCPSCCCCCLVSSPRFSYPRGSPPPPVSASHQLYVVSSAYLVSSGNVGVRPATQQGLLSQLSLCPQNTHLMRLATVFHLRPRLHLLALHLQLQPRLGIAAIFQL